MTWCSEYNAVPRFVLANSAIRCRFVDRFAGFRVPSLVSRQRFSPRGVSLPSVGSRRTRFPVFTGTTKALRLPVRARLFPYGFGCRFHALPPLFVFAEALLTVGEVARQAGDYWSAGVPNSGMLRPWTQTGSLRFPGDPSYAFALLQDPGRAGKTSPIAVLSVPPPVPTSRRPQQAHDLEADTGLWHPPPTLHEQCCHCPCKARFRLAGCASTGRGSNPLDRFERFQITFFLLSRTSPDASWVHAERLVHKLDTFTDLHRSAQRRIRGLIWSFYADLKAYRATPTNRRRRELRARFDRIFRRRTGFVTLDRLLARLHANQPELLMVLDRPEIPLHTNDSERDIRSHVTKRKISGGTHSDAGRDCRDAFLGLKQTCSKHTCPRLSVAAGNPSEHRRHRFCPGYRCRAGKSVSLPPAFGCGSFRQTLV